MKVQVIEQNVPFVCVELTRSEAEAFVALLGAMSRSNETAYLRQSLRWKDIFRSDVKCNLACDAFEHLYAELNKVL